MADINYHDRYFVTVDNNETGEFTADTILHYRQQQDIVWATYEGGGVRFGTLIAKVNAEGCLEMRYQHLNKSGEFRTGLCWTRPQVLSDGRYRLHEQWQMLDGECLAGSSVSEEIKR